MATKQEHQLAEWPDAVGVMIRPGDTVAVAIIDGRSPKIVIGEVLRINSHDSKGQPLRDGRYDRATRQILTFPTASVTVRPTGETRFGDTQSRTRIVTYKFPQNIIKLPEGTLPFDPSDGAVPAV